MKNKLIIALLIFSTFLSSSIWSQIIIKGPACVIPGTKYQYLITSSSVSWPAGASMQVCITGGVIADSAITCTASGAPFSYVQVQWNNDTSGSVQVKSTVGSGAIQIVITTALNGGTVETVNKNQSLSYNTIPSVINCSASSGGSCSPQYKYQWQQSQDMLAWGDVDGATEQNLKLTVLQILTTYYRRRVTEVGSGSIGYSDIATISVGPQMPTTSGLQYSENHKVGLGINFKSDNQKIF